MKKNITEHVFANIYKRFLTSFLLVLVLPIVLFSILYLSELNKLYEKRSIEQEQIYLDAVRGELDRGLENISMFAFYSNFLSYMQDYAVKKEFVYDEIKEMLRLEEVKQVFLEKAYYYTDVTPSKVYSSSGTLSWEYFAKVYLGEDNSEQLLQILDSGEALGLGIWKQDISGSGEYIEKLYFIVGTDSGNYWFFRLSEREISQIVNKDSQYSILFDGEGTQLLPFEKMAEFEENSEKYYKINSISDNGYFKLAKFIDKDAYFNELQDAKRQYFLILIIIMLLGVILSFALTIYNKRPLSDLYYYFTEKVKNIPDNLKGYDVFKYAIDSMDDKVFIIDNQYQKSNLLFRLCLGGNDDAKSLKELATKLGLFQKSNLYCMFVVTTFKDIRSYNNRVEMYLKEEAEYEFHRIDMNVKDRQIYIVGMSKDGAEGLEQVLVKMVDFFQNNMSVNMFLYMGQICSELNELHLSYVGIATRIKQKDSERKGKIIFCKSIDEKIDTNFYPDVELKKFSNILKEANIDGIDIMTDYFVGILKRCINKSFLYRAIFRDILEVYDEAIKYHNLCMDPAFQEIVNLKIEDNENVIQAIYCLGELFKRCIRTKGNKVDENFVYNVTKYIDENIQCSEMNVNKVADYFEMSVSNLSHRFKMHTNQKISDYITEKRFEYAGMLLKNTDYLVSDISAMLGYTQTSNFIRKFKQYYGVTPAEYRNSEKK